jgi:hypothetical protein
MTSDALYPEGTVLIEVDHHHRAVIAAGCPRMFDGSNAAIFPDLKHRQWGYYLDRNGAWGGPWHSAPKHLKPHPDPDSVWPKWAEFVAKQLID